MSLQINLPNSSCNYKLSGVYKLTLNTGYFHIGCSVHLRDRASAWKSLIKNKNRQPFVGLESMDKILECESGVFEIIELCNPNEVTEREAFYLNEYKDDCLMMSKSQCSWKPVLQHKLDGLFIKKHVSISAAVRYTGFSIGKIQGVLNKNRNHHKGMVFNYELGYQKRKRKCNKIIRNRKRGRNVLLFNSNGEQVGNFKKLKDVAHHIGCSESSIGKVLCGQQKTIKSYTLKYEEKSN